MRSDDDRLSQTFAALANSTRRAILARLAEGEATVNELAEPEVWFVHSLGFLFTAGRRVERRANRAPGRADSASRRHPAG